MIKGLQKFYTWNLIMVRYLINGKSKIILYLQLNTWKLLFAIQEPKLPKALSLDYCKKLSPISYRNAVSSVTVDDK